MADFVARVELHGVKHDSAIYDLLHDAMEERGFSRDIRGKNGTYEMPHATYDYEGTDSLDVVLAKAVAACAAVGYTPWTTDSSATAKTCGVIVVEGTPRWRGLKKK